ncbi:MAG: DNA polymerase III subunit gamma/tau, partial [Acutalibacteraceae bacterium]
MAYQALYRKYRPQTFSEVVGQEHITETLKNELAAGKTVHAYLFTGTRGTGKTSCAKILAKAVNCLSPEDGDPCLSCESCLSVANGENTDIVEIDAASNNSVDSIRELRDQVSFAPASSKYRVYIIDEVHMLTVSAFNALLKTLEEPPAHVIFILATTEVHKLPATILSRCQRFDFRRIEADRICERIQYIADKERLTVSDGAASLIAAAADGGMRDALSILDLCASAGKNIDEEMVEGVCGMAGGDYLIKLADFIKSRDAEGALMLIDRLYGNSVDMQRLLSELTSRYRDLMIIKTVKGESKPIVCSASKLKALEEQAADYDIKDIMYTLSVLQAANAGMQSGNRRCEMEMTVIRLCTPSLSYDLASLERRITALENGTARVAAAPAAIQKASTASEKPISPPENADTNPDYGEIPLPEYPADEPQISAPKPAPDGEITPVDNWDEVLRILKTSCPLIAGVLKGSAAYIKGQYLLIDAPNSQFRSLINSGNGLYKDSIRKAAQTVLGVTYKLGPYTAAAPKAEEDPLAALADRL